MTCVSWEHTRLGDKNGLPLTAVNHVSLVSIAITHFNFSQSVTRVFLSFLGVLSDGLRKKPLSFALGACHCRPVPLWPLPGESHVHDSSVNSRGKNGHAQDFLCALKATAWSLAPGNLFCSGFSHNLSLPGTLTLSPCGAGHADMAK